jgi:Gti1/Pac2 family transcription factor
MQQPTCKNIKIRSVQDAHRVFLAVQEGTLQMVTRRLDADERLALTSGCVYAWEERGPHSEVTGMGIERFTEGRRWSPSRVRDVRNFLFFLPFSSWHPDPMILQEFLFYYEKYLPVGDVGQSR